METLIVGILVAVVTIIFKGLNFGLCLFKGWTKQKALERKPIYAEDFFYKTDVYPFYLITQNSFRYCMQNKILERRDILEFKAKLNKCVNLKDYQHENFKNDCHEIYRKLKSTCISKKQMQALNGFLMPYIKVYKKTQIQEPTKKTYYGYLTVVK